MMDRWAGGASGPWTLPCFEKGPEKSEGGRSIGSATPVSCAPLFSLRPGPTFSP